MSMLMLISSFTAYSAYEDTGYEWGNVKIGGGGFVTGAIYHPLEKDLAYVRTDVGGMYRYDKDTHSWIQLCEWARADENLHGVDGFAVDPNDADVIYAALGTYWWLKGGLYKSSDRGETWELIKAASCNGNMGRRQSGECIAVDPANSDVIYFGTRRAGLLRSTDGG